MTGQTRTLAAILAALTVMMALVVASVPLYRLFCKVTGVGGTPRTVASAPDAPAVTGTMVVRFDGNVIKGLPWRFQPNQGTITVRLGEPTIATFSAENRGRMAITGTAAFNVTPAKAGQYVDKIQCFCFSQQTLAAGQKREMPVQFYIDPAIANDPNTSDITTITLSYSFFKSAQQNEGAS